MDVHSLQQVAITHPVTGELILANDIDGLCGLIADVDRETKDLYDAKQCAVQALLHLSTSTEKTRRLRGHKVAAILKMPDTIWEQAPLKAAWREYGGIVGEYLRIATLAPNAVAIRQMRSTDGSPAFNAMKFMILSAEKPSRSLPKVIIEPLKEAR